MQPFRHVPGLCSAPLLTLLIAPPAAAQDSCEEWATLGFFREATAGTVQACIDAGADPNAAIGGGAPLHVASLYNWDPEVFTVLIAAGASVHARGEGGQTPLLDAAFSNPDPDVITTLLDAGAEMNVWGHYEVRAWWTGNATPLHAAAVNRNPEIVAVLVEAGGDVNAREVPGAVTPLHLAAYINTNPLVVEELVDAGADVNATGATGVTPLHLSARRNAVNFPMLLRLGADPEALDDEGRTPLDHARDNAALQGLEVVRSSGGPPRGPAGGRLER